MEKDHYRCLDGWRAISILLVLATHMLPMGARSWRGNETTGQAGMALFFTLSGFLITRQLRQKQDVIAFFVRRLFRILPLAWLTIVVVFLWQGGDGKMLLSNLLFTQNLVHSQIHEQLAHFWSLCVEVQFYLFIGLLMTFTRFRGFYLLPAFWLGMVAFRSVFAPSGTIQTQYRVDEILSGACLALVCDGTFGVRARRFVAAVPLALSLSLLLLACLHWTWFVHPLRGLAASAAVGHTLLRSEADASAYRWLSHRALHYIATTSYALYVIHPLSMYGWLGTAPDPISKYARRSLCFLITFAAAHISTFYMEEYFIALGKRYTRGREKRLAVHHSEERGGGAIYLPSRPGLG